MQSLSWQHHFVPQREAPQWYEVSYLDAEPRRRSMLVLFLILWIALVDLCLPRTNIAILYVAPLILLAHGGHARQLGRVAGACVLLNYGIYFLKNAVNPSAGIAACFDYRLVNRTLVALMLPTMALVLQFWVRTRDESFEAELPERFRDQERQIGATLAILLCLPLIGVIALIDFLAPARFNLAILYPVPLFICAWTRSRKLLWTVFAVMALLAVGELGFAPPPTLSDEPSLPRNRLVAVAAMATVTGVLDYWLRRER